MKTIKLTDYEVDIKDSLTWGDKEKLQQEYINGMEIKKGGKEFDWNPEVTLNAKYKLLEISIKEIREKGKDKKIEFSKEWMNNLSIEDGDKLYDKVDELYNPKKKSKD